jgi:hypothetical protein
MRTEKSRASPNGNSGALLIVLVEVVLVVVVVVVVQGFCIAGLPL